MKKKTGAKKYISTSLMLVIINLMFAGGSFIFIFIDKPWLQILISIVFGLLALYYPFATGRTEGEKIMRERYKNNLNDVHAIVRMKLPIKECIFNLIGFLSLFVVIFIVIITVRIPLVQLILLIPIFQPALLMHAVGFYSLGAVVWYKTLIMILPYTILLAGSFVLGYLLSAEKARMHQREIATELRSFDN